MKITINGQEKSLSESQNLDALIKEIIPNSDKVIAELNGEIIKSDVWGTVTVKSGDTIELVSFVGGG